NIPRRVVYGVPPCDIHGLLILDDLFKRHYPDPYYIARRERTAILGVSFCVPTEGCLCKSMGTDVVEEGFDLFFSDLKDSYLVWVGSSLGDDMIKASPNLFNSNVTRKHLDKFIECKKERDEKFTRGIDMSVIPDIMELSYDNPIWEEIGERCLECGACTMVCPTCNCYNVIDEPSLLGTKGERKRHWDCCIFKDYSLVAGEHNFRPTRADRLRLWYTHKLQSFGYSGKPACVGCGRCIDTCPVDINILTVAKGLLSAKV
ncbi:4Fe-4S dicluster domain-containing protein, partial [candidate division WOR-3 bacterium]|nr:4Fe-4S dicluster domain-containing protein [candidate division WOR-3 bacterium]